MAEYMPYAYSTYTASPYIAEINRRFDNLMKDLQDEQWKIEEGINSWAQTLRFQIDEHAKEQKSLLQSYYNDRLHILNAKRREIENEMRKCNPQYDHDPIHNLLEQCRTLKFELLVVFDYEDKPFSFIQCVTKEHLAQKKKNESSATKTGNYTSESKDRNRSEKNIDPYTDPTRDPISTIGQQTTRSGATSNPHDSSISGHGGQSPQMKGNDRSEDKCPVCLMIFPSYMKLEDRQRHTNEHLT